MKPLIIILLSAILAVTSLIAYRQFPHYEFHQVTFYPNRDPWVLHAQVEFLQDSRWEPISEITDNQGNRTVTYRRLKP